MTNDVTSAVVASNNAEPATIQLGRTPDAGARSLARSSAQGVVGKAAISPSGAL